MTRQDTCKLELRCEPGKLYCRLSGDLDSDRIPAIETSLDRWMEQTGGSVLLDLNRVDYLGADALRLLYRLHETALRAGGRLLLAADSTHRRLFEIVGLSDVLTVQPSENLPSNGKEQEWAETQCCIPHDSSKVNGVLTPL